MSYVVSSALASATFRDYADLDRAVQPGSMSASSDAPPLAGLGRSTCREGCMSPWSSGAPVSPTPSSTNSVVHQVANNHQFPAFVDLDMVIYRTFEYRKRRLAGVQLFNTTHHFNTFDVYAVPARRAHPSPTASARSSAAS